MQKILNKCSCNEILDRYFVHAFTVKQKNLF